MKLRELPHIRIVDDERELCLLYGLVLNNHGYKMTEAHSGSEAVEMLDQIRPDVVITDFRMPSGNGLGVIEKAKSRNIPVILVSGFSESLASKDLYNVTVMTKPVNFSVLMDAIDKAIKDKRLQDAS